MERLVFRRKLLTYQTCQLIISRTKFKSKPKQQKKASRTITASDRALDYFDNHYKLVLGDLWPSVRISLLSHKKTCAILNNYCEENTYYRDFLNAGAVNILDLAENRQKQIRKKRKSKFGLNDKSNTRGRPESNQPSEHFKSTINETEAEEDEIDIYKNMDRTNLDLFMPAKRILSETTEERLEEARQSIYTPKDVRVDIVGGKSLTLPEDLTVMAFPAGDVSTLPDPKVNRPNGHLCHFFIDAASLLPVILLDLEDGDNVLDLCAAPGGKSLCMLQTGKLGSLTCNDKNGSRLHRLRSIFHYYLPKPDQQHIEVSQKSGQLFTEPVYDKVLVDVPCNTDRNVVLVDENNFFGLQRSSERLELPKIQQELLISGIKSCKPGGSVVYSTCTISPVQNDGVIQDTLDYLWRETSIVVEIVDSSEIKDIFRDTFVFYDGCRFGQLVLPSLSQNYGPMYMCKLTRVA